MGNKFAGGGGLILWRGNCLELMAQLKDASVHMVLCDLPYGITNCAWDKKIDAVRLWAEYRRALAPGGAVALFAQGRFVGELMSAAPKGWFRHDWVWDKRAASGWLTRGGCRCGDTRTF